MNTEKTNESKERLHKMIDKITRADVAEYLETFIRLFLEKWGGVEA